MFARHVSLRLKPNSFTEFTRIFENETLPMLNKQPGFRDEITLGVEGAAEVTAISLWDTKDQAVTYETAAYPTVLKSLERVLDGPPQVRNLTVIHSTMHKLTNFAAA